MRDGPDTARRTALLELVAASSAALLQELALIRWLPAEVRVLGYFPNLVLIAAFLGLGVGSLRARDRSWLVLWPVLLVVLTGSALLLGRVAFTAEGVTEHLWLLYEDLPPDAPVVEGVRLPVVILFLLTALSFVPLGQIIGRRLQTFAASRDALHGYAADLGGSLAGVVLFALVSYGSLRPVWWFAPFLAVGLVFYRRRPGLATGHVAAVVVVVALLVRSDDADLYSPYYALTAVGVEGLPDVRIRANGSLHQVAADMTAYDIDLEWRRRALDGYRIPHRALGRPIRRALVLGAGTGNDVAVLLDSGASEIHAVEIDPGIIRLGRDVHPNHPYADPRVRVHNTDARTFLQHTDETFDLIVFGTLDSMTRLSALSSVRLDNFVYTREAIRAARGRLTDDGGLALYFMVGEPYIHRHLVGLLADAFGRAPAVVQGSFSMFNTVYMAGPAFLRLPRRAVDVEVAEEARAGAVDLPGDDWPYLYLPERGVTPFYAGTLLLLALLAAGLLAAASPAVRAAPKRPGSIDVEMVLYGAAFLLMETKFVTSMNLLWGATWLTSAVVFGAVLATILGGTLLRSARPGISWTAAGPGLVLSLLVVYAVPVHALALPSAAARLAASALYVGLPVFFASLCFADRFAARPSLDAAFAWNLVGAVLGGLLEFLSMTLGFRALTLVALAAYLLAFLTALRARALTLGPASR